MRALWHIVLLLNVVFAPHYTWRMDGSCVSDCASTGAHVVVTFGEVVRGKFVGVCQMVLETSQLLSKYFSDLSYSILSNIIYKRNYITFYGLKKVDFFLNRSREHLRMSILHYYLWTVSLSCTKFSWVFKQKDLHFSEIQGRWAAIIKRRSNLTSYRALKITHISSRDL